MPSLATDDSTRHSEAPVPSISSSDNRKESSLPLPTRIAFIGNYLPRECGIATFTTDLCAAVATEYRGERLFAIPVNDPDSSYDYPERVRLELTQEDLASYERAADFLNFNGNDLVCLQHNEWQIRDSMRNHVDVTHPHVRRRDGESCREGLRDLAKKLGVSPQLIFNNRFVSAEELVEHVGAADVYITPYRQEAHVVSGTLAIETAKGWMTIYHGVRRTASGSIYRLGLALFDLHEPEVCLQRGDSWMFGPEATSSAAETSATWYSPAVKQSRRMEIRFTSITERQIPAWRWQRAAYDACSHGWTLIQAPKHRTLLRSGLKDQICAPCI